MPKTVLVIAVSVPMRDESVPAKRNACAFIRQGQRVQVKSEIVGPEGCTIGQFNLGESPQPTFKASDLCGGALATQTKAGVDVFVEVLEELGARLGHLRLNLLVQLPLQAVEGQVDFACSPTLLVYVTDAFLEIDTGFERAEDLVGRAEDTVE